MGRCRLRPYGKAGRPEQQYVQPFQIFDNVYYVGIDWVAAYLIDTGAGLVLIDSLCMVNVLERNIRQLGFDPADMGHHQHPRPLRPRRRLGAFSKALWCGGYDRTGQQMLWRNLPLFYISTPRRDIVAQDGDEISLGDNTFTLHNTLRYAPRWHCIATKHDGDNRHTAMTLGGVGLTSGVERTQTYIDSYQRLQSLQDDIQVSYLITIYGSSIRTT